MGPLLTGTFTDGAGNIVEPNFTRVVVTEPAPPMDETPLSEESAASTPIAGLRPVQATNPQPVESFEIAPGMPPVQPAYNVCAASRIRIVPGHLADDTTHQASRECSFPGCPMGMCDEHVFDWTFDGVKYDICWRSYRDLRGLAEAGSADPWLDLIREDSPELADNLALVRLQRGLVVVENLTA
jgi:hypothetical protein